jgi:hypothetical protein
MLMQGIRRLVNLLCLTLAGVMLPCLAVAIDFQGSLGADRHQRYVAPLANPLFNETPYITTELRPIYFYQQIPEDFLTDGGHINLVAVELRVALTERLGIIASKDGYADINFDSVLPDEDGFANISLGMKYALLSLPKADAIVSVGVEYEAPVGNLETGGISLQGDGDGFFDLFLSAAKAFGHFGMQANIGVNLAVDQDHDSSQFHFSVHTNYEILPGLFPLIEWNGFTTIDHGNRTAGDFEGIDLVNFGSIDSGTVVTFAGGLRYRFNRHVQVGSAYETPVTDREDIMAWRVYVDLVLSY